MINGSIIDFSFLWQIPWQRLGINHIHWITDGGKLGEGNEHKEIIIMKQFLFKYHY